MKPASKILWAVVLIMVAVLGYSPTYLESEFHQWKRHQAANAANAATSPPNFAQWKAEIQKEQPSLVEVELQNDAAKSFAFFFDSKANRLIVCWYGDVLPHGAGGYGVSIDPDQTGKASVMGSFLITHHFTSLFIQIRSKEVEQFSFSFGSHFERESSGATFEARKRGPDDWVVTRG